MHPRFKPAQSARACARGAARGAPPPRCRHRTGERHFRLPRCTCWRLCGFRVYAFWNNFGPLVRLWKARARERQIRRAVVTSSAWKALRKERNRMTAPISFVRTSAVFGKRAPWMWPFRPNRGSKDASGVRAGRGPPFTRVRPTTSARPLHNSNYYMRIGNT